MKKFMLFAALAAVCFWACDPQEDPTPTPQNDDPVEGTSDWSVIGTVLGSNWDKDVVMAAEGGIFVLKNLKLEEGNEFKIRYQKGWDTNRGGTFAKLGEGFAVANNGDNIKPGLAGFYDIYYNPEVEQMAVCEKNKKPEWQEKGYEAPITIDGDFSDWAKLPAANVASATSDPESPWDAVKEIRVYADELYVFFYLEYDSAQITDILAATNDPSDPEHNELPIRLNLNTDGEFTTGYTSYSLDGYDFIVEGGVATDGAWSSFDGTLHQRIDGGWVVLLEGGSGMCSGAGSGNKYEICLIREIFNSAAGASKVPMPMGDEFQAGVRFYTAPWGELANMPDGAVTDDNAKGYGHLLNVTTVAL